MALLLGNTRLSVAKEHFFVFPLPFPSLQCGFSLFYLKSLHFTRCLFVCLCPSIHPTLLFGIDFFLKSHVSIVFPGQQRSQLLGFCVGLANLSPTEVLVA